MVKNVVKNSSDPGQISKAEDEQKDRERDLDWIMSQPRGRRWLYELIYGTCHMQLQSHVPGCSDSTAFNEGARSIGCKLDDAARQRPGKYLEMLKENGFDE